MAKESEIVVYDKVKQVYIFMINVSKQRKDVVHFFSKKWGEEGYFTSTNEASKHRTVDNYIRKVKKTYLNFENEVGAEKGRAIARLEDLYAKNIKIQDYKGALQVQRELSEMLGLKAPIKVETTNTNINVGFDTEEDNGS